MGLDGIYKVGDMASEGHAVRMNGAGLAVRFLAKIESQDKSGGRFRRSRLVLTRS